MRKQEKDEKQKQRNRIARVMARVRKGEAGSRDTQKEIKMKGKVSNVLE